MPKPKPRIFIDTNVILSGLHSPGGSPGRLLDAYLEGVFAVVISAQVLDELVRVMKEKVPAAIPALQELLVSYPPEMAPEAAATKVVFWSARMPAGDAAIVAAAIEAKVDCLVSGDRHLLAQAGEALGQGLVILTPAGAVARFLTTA